MAAFLLDTRKSGGEVGASVCWSMVVLRPCLGTHFGPVKFLVSKGRSGLYKMSRQGLDSTAAHLAGNCQFLEITLALCQHPRMQARERKKKEFARWSDGPVLGYTFFSMLLIENNSIN